MPFTELLPFPVMMKTSVCGFLIERSVEMCLSRNVSRRVNASIELK